jgi:hypothetical protein
MEFAAKWNRIKHAILGWDRLKNAAFSLVHFAFAGATNSHI